MLGFLAALGLLASSVGAASVDDVDLVIGTGGMGFGYAGDPIGPSVPFGACRVEPDTSEELTDPYQIHYGGYYHGDNFVRAFSHTRMVGSGAVDYGQIGVMPIRGSPTAETPSPRGRQTRLSHAQEEASPGFYSVRLPDASITSSLTVGGPFSAIHEHTCDVGPDGNDTSVCGLTIDFCHAPATEELAKWCPSASLSSVTDFSSINGTVVVEGSMVVHGSLSGRYSHGPGVPLFVHIVVEQEFGSNATSGLPRGSPAAQPAAVVLQHWEAGNLSTPWSPSHRPPLPLQTSTGSLGLSIVQPRRPSAAAGVTWRVRVGMSFLDLEGARNNFAAEQRGGNPAGALVSFEAARQAARAAWADALSRFDFAPVETNDPKRSVADDIKKLTTALYHSQLAPSRFNEHDGRYPKFGSGIGSWPSDSGMYLSDMSIWDIHRCQTPLLTLIQPGVSVSITNSLLRMTEDGGKLPRWPLANVYTGCMDGSHAVAIMADTVHKGLPNVNATEVLQVSVTAVDNQAQGSYGTLGWVPVDEHKTGASSTMEYAYDDGVASALAGLMGDNDTEARLWQRSLNYRNVLKVPELKLTPFPCPRNSTGHFHCPLMDDVPYPLETHYTEGDAWQWRWYAPHDVRGLVDQFPPLPTRADSFAHQLGEFFNKTNGWIFGTALPNPYYWAGNEPGLLIPWQSPFAGNKHAHVTQKAVRDMISFAYTAGPEGVPGNDDFGAISSWLVWAYVGMYPLTGAPGGTYILAAPSVANATFQLPATDLCLLYPDCTSAAALGSTPVLTVIAANAGPDNAYAAGATLNGTPLPTPFVNHTAIMQAAASRPGGAVLEFTMVPEPTTWSTD